MNYEQLLSFLQIDEASEFEYFENFADLIESEEEISEEALYKLINECDQGNLGEIIENYFEEIMDAIPDDSTDIFTLIETIKLAFIGLLQSAEEEVALVHFCDELLRFRSWYCIESMVHCRNIDNGEIEDMPLRDALVVARIEKLEGDKYHYDFNDCLDYELEEYIMSYGDMAKLSREDMDEADSLDDSYDDKDYYDSI